jgi:hypothetical protein
LPFLSDDDDIVLGALSPFVPCGRFPRSTLWQRGTFSFEEVADGNHQFVAARSELVDSLAGYVFQDSFSAGQQRDQHAAAVFASASASHVSACFEPVDEFHGAVMLQREALRQNSDGGLVAVGKTANHQQKKVLLGLETRRAGGGISVAQELSNAIAQFGEGPVFFGGDFTRHLLSVS